MNEARRLTEQLTRWLDDPGGATRADFKMRVERLAVLAQRDPEAAAALDWIMSSALDRGYVVPDFID